MLAQSADSLALFQVSGYYVPAAPHSGALSDFEEIAIAPDDSICTANHTIGYVVFFSDTTIVRVDSQAICLLQNWILTRDSLKFQTRDCLSEHYLFSGHWLLPLGSFDQEGDPPALEGVLARYTSGHLKVSKYLLFKYSRGT